MARIRAFHSVRMPARLAVAVVAVLGGGVLAALPATAATSPSPVPSPAPSQSSTAAPNHAVSGPSSAAPPGVCSTNRNGKLVNCPKPVPKSQQPAGAKNQSTIAAPVPTSDLSSLVDTRTWTSGGGNTYPGATTPFGMTQWSPDTEPNRSDGGGYNYGDSKLTGYALTHVSGPGCGAAGDVPILPITGALASGDPNSLTTAFSNSGEVAQAGYYSAQSNQPNTITSEFTGTQRTSMGRFDFPATTQAGFLIKLQDSENGDFGDSAQVVGNNEITGSDTSGHFCGESNNDGQQQEYTVNFAITFDQPFTSSQVITEPGQSNPAAVLVTFDTTSDQVVQAKVGTSYVSTANAEQDVQAENPSWNFDTVKSAAQQTWDKLLGEVHVAGGTYADTQEFYSLLYKDFMQPNVVSDVNGQFMGSDMKVHTVAAGQQAQYGTYSGWDIYHSLSQLQAMLDPSAAGQEAQSLVNYYSEDKILQQWGYMQDNNYVMVGDPAQSIISDLYAFGGHNFDTKTALSDMLAQATTVNDVRPGEALEQKYGYLPTDGTYGCCNAHGVVATELEYDSEDLALANFASAMGDTKDAAMLTQRANNWENMFDPSNNLLVARYQNGNFVQGETPLSNEGGEPYYVEGDAYEYLFNTPNDYSALFSLLGGPSKVAQQVRTYLSQPNGFGMFAQLTNEFDFGEQYMGDYAQDPAGTQEAVNTARTTMYAPGPSLDNNDDLGANSSTFIWEMLGMYPENSGSGDLVFNGPAFPQASIDLPNGKTIAINAPGASSSNYYVQNLKINGSPYQKQSVPFSTLEKGATLDWTMGSKPSDWGSAPQDAPPSYTAGLRPVVGYAASPQVTVAPGGTATVQIGARNATNSGQSVQTSVSAPSGLTASESPSKISVPPDGQGTATLTVHASSSAAQTFYTVPVSMSDNGTSLPTVNVTVLVAPPGSLLSTFNNAGISDDSNPAAGNFDSDGNSYSAQALSAAGFNAGQPVTVGGITYNWPLPSSGYPDNTIASGQQVTVNAPAGTQQIGFLGAATNGPNQGLVTLKYSDGSTSQYWLGLSDWTLNAGNAKPSYGNQTAATLAYRNCPGCTGGKDNTATYVFGTTLPVNPAKTLTSVTLPNGATQGQQHIFAIGTTTAAMSGPVVSSVSPATASAGQQVTISGSGFGSSQGSGYVAFSDNGTSWGAPGDAALQVGSWSDTSITFTVPQPSGSNGQNSVYPGSMASVMVVNNSGQASDSGVLEITPTSNIADYFNNTGISPDSNQACADYDGDGFSYSADALAADGLTPGSTVTADGHTFTWPNVQPCSPDNVLASGETMLVPGTSGASSIGLLGSSTNGSSQGAITINYTDGSSSTQTVSFTDWAQTAGSGDVTVATMPYRNSNGGASQSITMYVFATSVPVDSSKTVASITFPNVSNQVGSSVTAMHIFAVNLG
jgi:predicted alpha-1,2-mannosidase